jgi:hypothetical protein
MTQHYFLVQVNKHETDAIHKAVKTYIRQNQSGLKSETKRQRLILERLEAEHAKLLQAYYAGFMALETFGKEQERIATARLRAKELLTTSEQGFDDIEVQLEQALDLMRNWHKTYDAAPKQLRRKLNQAFFKCVYIDEIDEVITTNGAIFANPFAGLMALSGKPSSAMQKLGLSEPINQTKCLVNAVNKPVFYADSSKEEHLVGVRGLEPPASASRTLRATNCATPRNLNLYLNLAILAYNGWFCQCFSPPPAQPLRVQRASPPTLACHTS